MNTGCLRLPENMAVTYEVPADYGIYTFKSGETIIMSAYMGNAPRLPNTKAALELTSKEADAHVFSSQRDGETRLDVIIAPRDDKRMRLHLFAPYSSAQRSNVAQVLAGLRACLKPSREKMICSAESAWGQQLSEFVDSTRP